MSWFLRIFGLGCRLANRSASVGSDFPSLWADFSFFSNLLRFLAARTPCRFADSARILALVVFGFRFLDSTRGVLSSSISLLALALSLRGTLFGLWLAVRRRNPRGTCWNARVELTAWEVAMLCSRDRISNSRAATKAGRSSSPSFNAASAGWAGMCRAECVFALF